MSQHIPTTTNNPYLEQANLAARSYDRQRHLPALLALWPSQLDDFGLAASLDIIQVLDGALQAERRRGRASHWCYDLNRHLALASALKAEQSHVAKLRRKDLSGRNALAGQSACAAGDRE